jgi:hypothetical protein
VYTRHVSGFSETLLKPLAPLLHTLPGAGAGEDALDARVDRLQVPDVLYDKNVYVV